MARKSKKPSVADSTAGEIAPAKSKTTGLPVPRLVGDDVRGGTGAVPGLRLRVIPAGSRTPIRRVWVVRFTLANGKTQMIELGTWDRYGRNGGLNLEGARAAARALLAERQAAPGGDVLAARRQAALPEPVAAADSLGAVLNDYIAYLGERPSAGDAANAFKLHVPAEAKVRAAKSITSEEIKGWIGKLVADGKRTSARKLRSYLRAAYAKALSAGLDPFSSAREIAIAGLVNNPVAPIGTASSGARDRVLDDDELRAFIAEVRRIPEGAGESLRQIDGRSGEHLVERQRVARLRAEALRDVILLTILTGGQRLRQLLRAQILDVNGDMLTLYDPKGRGRASKPRTHDIPIVGETREIIDRRLAAARTVSDAGSLFRFSPTRRAIDETEFSTAVTLISRRLVANKLVRAPFQASDIRRTAETLLARLKVSKDTRAQLLSHGIAGVQAAHYDRHDYAAEKIDALTRLHAHLDALEHMPAHPEIICVFTAQEHQRRADQVKRRLNAGKLVAKRDLEAAA